MFPPTRPCFLKDQLLGVATWGCGPGHNPTCGLFLLIKFYQSPVVAIVPFVLVWQGGEFKSRGSLLLPWALPTPFHLRCPGFTPRYRFLQPNCGAAWFRAQSTAFLLEAAPMAQLGWRQHHFSLSG